MIRMIIKAILIVVALLTIVSLFGLSRKAKADGFTTNCERSQGSLSCSTFEIPERGAKIISVPASDFNEPRYKAWLKFCEPQAVADELGVEHLVYAHAGCEHGRIR